MSGVSRGKRVSKEDYLFFFFEAFLEDFFADFFEDFFADFFFAAIKVKNIFLIITVMIDHKLMCVERVITTCIIIISHITHMHNNFLKKYVDNFFILKK